MNKLQLDENKKRKDWELHPGVLNGQFPSQLKEPGARVVGKHTDVILNLACPCGLPQEPARVLEDKYWKTMGNYLLCAS